MVEEYLGFVHQVTPSMREGGSIDYGRLRPTHVARDGAWHPIDAFAHFQDKGMVFWYKPSRGVKQGAAWAFNVAPQPNYDPTQGRTDRMQVAPSSRSRALLESISLPEIADLTEFRHALSTMTVKLPVRPIGRVLLRVPGPTPQWVGPIDPPAIAGNADPSQLLVVASDRLLRVHDFPEEAFQDIMVEGKTHRLLRPAFDLSAHSGYFSLESDEELFRALLRRVKKWNPELADVVEPAQKLIKAFEAGVTNEYLTEDERLREGARLRAARALLRGLESRLRLESGLMEFVVIELLELPLVKAQIEVKKKQVSDHSREELRAQMQQEMDAARQTLLDTQAATERARTEHRQLEATMVATVQAIVSQAVPKLTEHALFRALDAQTPVQPQRSPAVELEPVRIAQARDEVRRLTSRAEIAKMHLSAAAANHVDPFVLHVLTSLLAGTGMVLLGGACADRAARAAAGVLASGSAVRVSVTAATFGMTDLLNAACSPVGENDPPAATLGEFLQRVAHEDGLSLVILQGCNRAPLESSLLELIEIASAPRGVRRLAWTDRRGEVEEARIDGRVLFVGSLASGQTTFTIPMALAHRLPLLWADRNVTPTAALETAAPWVPTRVTFDAWKLPEETLSTLDEAMHRAFTASFPQADSGAVVATYLRLVGAAFGKNIHLGTAEAFAALVAGRSSQDRWMEFAKQLPAEVHGAFASAVQASSQHLSRYYAEEQHG